MVKLYTAEDIMAKPVRKCSSDTVMKEIEELLYALFFVLTGMPLYIR